MSPTPRHIVVKTNLNEDEFRPFRAQCAADGIMPATQLRCLIHQYIRQPANITPGTVRRERPKLGRVPVQLPCASRKRGGNTGVRLRL